MTKLVACVGLGKGTWSDVLEIINKEDWEQVLVVTDARGKEKFPSEGVIFLECDFSKAIISLQEEVLFKLKPHINLGDVALNLVSGTGKEHMAILSALLKLGAGIRLIAWNGNEVKEL